MVYYPPPQSLTPYITIPDADLTCSIVEFSDKKISLEASDKLKPNFIELFLLRQLEVPSPLFHAGFHTLCQTD